MLQRVADPQQGLLVATIGLPGLVPEGPAPGDRPGHERRGVLGQPEGRAELLEPELDPLEQVPEGSLAHPGELRSELLDVGRPRDRPLGRPRPQQLLVGLAPLLRLGVEPLERAAPRLRHGPVQGRLAELAQAPGAVRDRGEGLG